MRRLAKVLTWVLLIVVCALIGYRRYVQHESALSFNAFLSHHRSTVDQNLEKFLSERSRALAIPALQIKTRTKDAGARLNGWVAWPGSPGGLAHFAKKPESIVEFVKKLRAWGKSWAEHGQDANLGEFDFSWMKELRNFDYWHLDAAPAVKQALQARPTILPLEIPSPDPESLIGWSELRLLLGIQQRAFEDALADTSHLASLLFSSENSAMADLGLRILTRERQAAEQYRKVADARFDYEKARIPSEASIEAGHWVLQRVPLFFNLFTDRDTIMDVFADGKLDLLGCAGANTSGPRVLRNLRVVGDLFADNQKVLTRVLHQEWKDCTLGRLRLYWDTAQTTTSDLAAEPFIPPALPELMGFEIAYPVFDVIAKISRRDHGTLPAIMEYSSALKRAMAVAWARQSEY